MNVIVIVGYFPVLTYIILIIGAIYLLCRKQWIEDESSFRRKSLILLGIVILCTLFNSILLTVPVFDGSAIVSNLSELLIWVWLNLLVLAILCADIARTYGSSMSKK